MTTIANRALPAVVAAAILPGFFLPGIAAGEAKEGPAVQVVTYYPNMPAATIEKSITARIERWFSQYPAALRVSSRSIEGVSIVRVVCRDGTDPNEALKQVNELALRALPTLPAHTLPPVTLPYDPRQTRPLGMMVVQGSAGLGALTDTARREVRNWLGTVKSLVAPVTVGGKDRTLLFRLDHDALEKYQLSATDVTRAMPAGVAYFGDNSLLIDSASVSVREVEQLPVRTGTGKTVRLRDLGRAEEQQPPQTMRFRSDGRPAVAVLIYCQESGQPGEVVEGVSERLPALQRRMPRGQELRWVPFGAGTKDRPADDGLLVVSLRAPSSSSLPVTEKRVAAVERVIHKVIPAGQRQPILVEIGVSADWSAVYTANAGPMDATIWVQLSRDRKLSAAEYAAKLRRALNEDQQFADLAFRFASRDMPAPLDVRITGGKPAEQRKLAEQVRRRVMALKGTVDVDIDQRADAPYLVLAVDRARAAAVGLSAKDVLSQILRALPPESSRDKNFWIDSKDGDGSLIIPCPANIARKWEEVADRPAAGTNTPQPVKLGRLARLQRTAGPVEIDRIDGSRVLDVRANVEGRPRRDVVEDVRRMLRELKLPDGVKVELAE